MVNTVCPSMQPPQVPSPPMVARQALSELVNYYRELARYHRSSVDYHQQLLERHASEAEAAEKQLASIEAILHPLQINSSSSQASESVDRENSDRAKGQQVNGTGKISLLEEKAQDEIAEVDSEESKPDKKATEVEKSNSKTTPPSDLQSPNSKSKTKSSSTKTAKTKQPTTPKNPAKTKSSTSTNSSRLPYSKKLTFYETTVNAVAVCLQEFYPRVVSTEDVIKYYYPEGLAVEDRKKAYAAFGNCLSKGAGKQGWVRTSVGKYRWKNEGETKI